MKKQINQTLYLIVDVMMSLTKTLAARGFSRLDSRSETTSLRSVDLVCSITHWFAFPRVSVIALKHLTLIFQHYRAWKNLHRICCNL